MKTREEMVKYSEQLFDISNISDVSDIDTDFYAYLLDNISVEIRDTNRFFVATNCEYISSNKYSKRRIPITKKFLDDTGLRKQLEASAYNAGIDFGHTCPEWNNILGLGIAGLRQRAVDYSSRQGNTPEQNKFYNNIIKVYDAAIRYMDRAAKVAEEAGKTEMATGIRNLMMWQTLREISSELCEYKNIKKDRSLGTMMLSAIDELLTGGISPEECQRAAEECATEDPALSRKLSDIAMIYTAFNENLTARLGESTSAPTLIFREVTSSWTPSRVLPLWNDGCWRNLPAPPI